ncbi:hypothetical protein QTP88_019820 [Uroleucon formosanum]
MLYLDCLSLNTSQWKITASVIGTQLNRLQEGKAPVKKLSIEQLKNSQITEQYKNKLNDALRTVERKAV